MDLRPKFEKLIKPYAGPVTFGEIAYQLLNQTLVYAEIMDLAE